MGTGGAVCFAVLLRRLARNPGGDGHLWREAEASVPAPTEELLQHGSPPVRGELLALGAGKRQRVNLSDAEKRSARQYAVNASDGATDNKGYTSKKGREGRIGCGHLMKVDG